VSAAAASACDVRSSIRPRAPARALCASHPIKASVTRAPPPHLGSYVAGCYNFDPLGLYGMLGADAAGRKGMRELETAHGRFAMIAISVWAFVEPLTKVRGGWGGGTGQGRRRRPLC